MTQMVLEFERTVGPRLRRPGAGRKPVEMAGARFGRWLVIERAGLGPGGHVTWLCRCDCGADGIVSGDGLRRGRSQSCGCRAREVSRELVHAINNRSGNRT